MLNDCKSVSPSCIQNLLFTITLILHRLIYIYIYICIYLHIYRADIFSFPAGVKRKKKIQKVAITICCWGDNTRALYLFMLNA